MEYLLLILEFFLSKKIRSYIGLIVVPVFISIFMYNTISVEISENQTYGNIITLLGILLGFTISLFAIFLSADNDNISKSKTTFTKFIVFGKELSVFDIMQTSIAYVIMMECLLLILNITIPLALESAEAKNLFLVVNIGVLSHIVIILLRSILDFYFALSKRS
jgi:hypothetical protein